MASTNNLIKEKKYWIKEKNKKTSIKFDRGF